MTTKYQFDDLTGIPNQGMLENSIATSSMAQTVLADISYHPVAHWLVVWFTESLSETDQATLVTLVDACLGVTGFKVDVGSEYFELAGVEGARWRKHKRRVKFSSPFDVVPKLRISNAKFDGAGKLEVMQVTKEKFDFQITAVGSSRKSRGSSVKGLTSIEFDWEAKSWE